jgi:nucleoside-diphosphate-sugar epimerase
MAERGDTVLITGSSGFIGQALAVRLSERYRVVGLDLAEPKRPVRGVPTVRIDLTSDESVRAALAEAARRTGGAPVASVVHLAACYDLSGEPDPKYRTVTVEGTRRLLRELQAYEVGQFVFASTLLVHAPCARGERIDESWPVDAKWPYPESKVETEALIRQERGPIPAVILRLAGVYDEQCRAAFVAQQIARIHERTPTSYLFAGDPESGQPYLHLEDLVEAVARVVDRRRQLARGNGAAPGRARDLLLRHAAAADRRAAPRPALADAHPAQGAGQGRRLGPGRGAGPGHVHQAVDGRHGRRPLRAQRRPGG